MIKGVIGLAAIGIFVSVGYIFWDEARLDDVIRVVAQNSELGSSAHRISLPADRLAMISIAHEQAGNACGSVMVKNGVVRHAEINEKDVAATLRFQQGIDLTAYADELVSCDQISITLIAKAGFGKATLELGYADGKIVKVGEPRFWD